MHTQAKNECGWIYSLIFSSFWPKVRSATLVISPNVFSYGPVARCLHEWWLGTMKFFLLIMPKLRLSEMKCVDLCVNGMVYSSLSCGSVSIGIWACKTWVVVIAVRLNWVQFAQNTFLKHVFAKNASNDSYSLTKRCRSVWKRLWTDELRTQLILKKWNWCWGQFPDLHKL